MSDEREPRRLFSEKDVSRVLKRATELQEAEGPAAGAADVAGLSLEDLQQIAAEVGIDPHHLAAAVAELDQEDGTADRFHWLGAPTSLELDRVFEGEVSEDQWEKMVEEIRESFGLVGSTGHVGRSYEWTHESSEQQAHVRVTSSGGQTRVHLAARYDYGARITFITSTMLALLSASILAGSIPESAFLNFWTFVVSMLVAFTLGARFVFGRSMRKSERKAHHLLARMEQIIAEPATETAPTPLPEQTPQLDASLLNEAAPEEALAQTQSRTKTPS